MLSAFGKMIHGLTGPEWKDWATLLAAVAALGSAVAALVNARTGAKARKQALLNELLNYRYGEQMLAVLTRLRLWYDRTLGKPYDVYRTERQKAKKRELATGIIDPESSFNKLDNCRRYFYMYFRRLKDLLDAGLIAEREIPEHFANASDLSILLGVIWPMAKAVDDRMFFMELRPAKTAADLLELHPSRVKPIQRLRWVPGPVGHLARRREELFRYFAWIYWKYKDRWHK